MGAILSQLNKEGEEHPICYASRSCNAAEQNYSSFDGECLAVVWATSRFRPYLFGNSFTLVTDHEPLKWIMTTQKLTGKPARWSLLLQDYDFTSRGHRQHQRRLPQPLPPSISSQRACVGLDQGRSFGACYLSGHDGGSIAYN